MRNLRDVEGGFLYGLQDFGTSGAPSPTDLRFGVLSPMDLGCEEFLRCGGCCCLGVRGLRFFGTSGAPSPTQFEV